MKYKNTKMTNHHHIPIELVSRIIGAMDSNADACRASEVCKAWNAEVYRSPTWVRDLNIKNAERARDILKKFGILGRWDDDDDIAVFFEHFKNLESFVFENDGGNSIAFLQTKNNTLKRLNIRADVIFSNMSHLSALRSLSLGKCEDYGPDGRQPEIRSSQFPQKLRHLELVECTRVFTMDAPLPHLESMTVIDVKWPFVIGGRTRRATDPREGEGSYLYVPTKDLRCPKLETLRTKNSRVSFFVPTTLIEIDTPPECVIRRVGDDVLGTSFEIVDNVNNNVLNLSAERSVSVYTNKRATYVFSGLCANNNDDDEPMMALVDIKPDYH
jgi:hypothetical protein